MYKELRWYDQDFGRKPTPEEIREHLNSTKCPMNNFIGNDDAVELMKAIAFFAWSNNNHAVVNNTSGQAEKINIALLGDAGLGKTTLAKAFAKDYQVAFCRVAQGYEDAGNLRCCQ